MRLPFWQTWVFKKNQEFYIIAGQKIAAVNEENSKKNNNKKKRGQTNLP